MHVWTRIPLTLQQGDVTRHARLAHSRAHAFACELVVCFSEVQGSGSASDLFCCAIMQRLSVLDVVPPVVLQPLLQFRACIMRRGSLSSTRECDHGTYCLSGRCCINDINIAVSRAWHLYEWLCRLGKTVMDGSVWAGSVSCRCYCHVLQQAIAAFKGRKRPKLRRQSTEVASHHILFVK